MLSTEEIEECLQSVTTAGLECTAVGSNIDAEMRKSDYSRCGLRLIPER
jgi:hypothetical protein